MLDNPLNAAQAEDHAARLRIIADAIAEQSQRVDLRVDGLHYEGPAARQFRVAMSERNQRAQNVARRLHEIADRVQASAHGV